MLAGVLGCALTLSAQITAHIGAGISVPIGDISSQRQLGAGVSAGGGYNFGPHFSVMVDFGSNSLSVAPALQKVLPFTSDTIWSFSLNPYFRFNTGHRYQPYVSGGYGVYSVHTELSGEKSVLKGGVNMGGGLALQISEDSSIYFEARLNSVSRERVNVSFIPFIVGFRWR